jgi:hypothetical protein
LEKTNAKTTKKMKKELNVDVQEIFATAKSAVESYALYSKNMNRAAKASGLLGHEGAGLVFEKEAAWHFSKWKGQLRRTGSLMDQSFDKLDKEDQNKAERYFKEGHFKSALNDVENFLVIELIHSKANLEDARMAVEQVGSKLKRFVNVNSVKDFRIALNDHFAELQSGEFAAKDSTWFHLCIILLSISSLLVALLLYCISIVSFGGDCDFGRLLHDVCGGGA